MRCPTRLLSSCTLLRKRHSSHLRKHNTAELTSEPCATSLLDDLTGFFENVKWHFTLPRSFANGILLPSSQELIEGRGINRANADEHDRPF